MSQARAQEYRDLIARAVEAEQAQAAPARVRRVESDVRWATRAGIHIDRAASAWLIRRFVDPRAEFVFVTDPDDVPA